VDIELSFIQKSIPKPEHPGISDTEGLHLNITVPSKAQSITGNEDFPVLVFIHGGGFAMGGNWWPQYDGAAIVKLSQDIGKPIIAININYRLGVPGFLTSPELRSAGYKPNNGLRDQRVALSWIKQYIKGFGGDPENVTVAGESAGGGEACYIRHKPSREYIR
jgi:carboxylesterase type B